MTRDWSKILRAVFPLLDGDDLTSCMLVSRQWRDIAQDEYFWKCLCFKRWPSICKRPPPTLSYRKLYQSFSKPPPSRLSPQLSFEDIEIYIDLWSGEELIFSESFSGSNIQRTRSKIIMLVEPSFTILLSEFLTVSVLVARRDTNKIACLLDKSLFNYNNNNAFQAYGHLYFPATYPIMYGIQALISFLEVTSDNIMVVSGIEIDFSGINFGYAERWEYDFLWLFDKFDWK